MVAAYENNLMSCFYQVLDQKDPVKHIIKEMRGYFSNEEMELEKLLTCLQEKVEKSKE